MKQITNKIYINNRAEQIKIILKRSVLNINKSF